MELVIDGIPVEVNRKKIKNMYLYVKPPEGAVTVSAPMRMPRQNIERFVREKRSWIEKRQERYRKQYGTEGMDITDSRNGSGPQIWPLDEKDRAFLRKQIAELLPKWEEKTGLHCSCWQIRDMKTRWGSCNIQKKRIWLNIQLAAYPRECLEYVVTHELVHLLVPGHGKEFWAYMDRFFPDWKRVRKELNGR